MVEMVESEPRRLFAGLVAARAASAEVTGKCAPGQVVVAHHVVLAGARDEVMTMSVAQHVTRDNSPRSKTPGLRQRILGELRAIRGRLSALERLLEGAPAPPASAMRSQLPGPGHKAGAGRAPRRSMRWPPRAAAPVPAVFPSHSCDVCAPYCDPNCPCSCHPSNGAARVRR